MKFSSKIAPRNCEAITLQGNVGPHAYARQQCYTTCGITLYKRNLQKARHEALLSRPFIGVIAF